jgi:hypothetical protein
LLGLNGGKDSRKLALEPFEAQKKSVVWSTFLFSTVLFPVKVPVIFTSGPQLRISVSTIFSMARPR